MTSEFARARREGRERAVELAYEAEIRDLSVDDLLTTLVMAPQPYAEELLRLEERHRDAATDLLAARVKGWSLDRMATMDVVILRLATAELIEGTAPTGVVLAEAVELASRYSTDESGPFVNGVLAAVARDLAEPEG